MPKVTFPDEAALPAQCANSLRDDALGPDATADDGIFTARCRRRDFENLVMRIGAATAQQGLVIVADILVA